MVLPAVDDLTAAKVLITSLQWYRDLIGGQDTLWPSDKVVYKQADEIIKDVASRFSLDPTKLDT